MCLLFYCAFSCCQISNPPRFAPKGYPEPADPEREDKLATGLVQIGPQFYRRHFAPMAHLHDLGRHNIAIGIFPHTGLHLVLSLLDSYLQAATFATRHERNWSAVLDRDMGDMPATDAKRHVEEPREGRSVAPLDIVVIAEKGRILRFVKDGAVVERDVLRSRL